MRKSIILEINTSTFKQKLYYWALNFKHFLILDSQHYESKYELLAAIGAIQLFQPQKNFFEAFHTWQKSLKDWAFGHFSYDLKNEIEKLESNHPDYIGFPTLSFFQPAFIIKIDSNKVEYLFLPQTPMEEIEKIHQTILNQQINEKVSFSPFKKRISKEAYFDNFHKIRQHIQLGDIYEMNYCQEFYTESFHSNPASTFQKLMEFSPMPFSAFYRNNHQFLLSASPERYIKKENTMITSQPIKGTIRRIQNDAGIDFKQKLAQSQKDLAENVMIVDLVRNDLSRTAVKNSVKVDEMCKVYEFPTVYQMISTIQSEVRKNTSISEIIKTTFPMGSMTGAPKIKAMELIEKYEKTKRGLYSGAVGYISPEDNFDFNVVIRSLQINQKTHYASFLTGGAITIQSNAEEEYDECFVKATALLKAFNTFIE